MIISVASGKGGTGKTTVSTNLAAALNSPVTFLDCDVEEPNAHLFLQPQIEKQEKVYTLLPQIDQSRCDLCRKCVDICRFSAITIAGSSFLLFPELCHSCGGCLVVCPPKCLSEGKRELGHIETGTRDHIQFHNGTLRIGEAMSPPLIKKLRQQFEKNGDMVIIDAPPGTSCPVIASMHGADYIVLVTEPTPFGLHDLKLAHETVQELGIPCGLVINRANLGDDGVHQYALEKQLPILMEIPFSKEIAALYSRGLLIIEELPEWKEKFVTLFETIREQVMRARSAS